MVSRMAFSVWSYFVAYAFLELFFKRFFAYFLPTFASVFGLKWVPGAPLNPKMSARLAKSSPRLNFHQIFIDFGRHFGSLGGALGTLLDELGHLRDIFFAFLASLFRRFLGGRFLTPFRTRKSSKKVLFLSARMWLLYSK